jgi:FkbM family methyltransferase
VVSFLRKYYYYFVSILRLLSSFDDPVLLVKIFLRPGDRDLKILRLRSPNLWFKVRGALDVWTIKETFLDRFYEKHGFAVQPHWQVIDVGAGLGDYTLYAAVTQPDAHIYAFEPYPESFTLMQENLRLNAVTNAQAFDNAIAAASGELILDLSGGEPLQFQSHAQKAAHIEKSLSVHAFSLVDALEMLDMESCDLLKMDCEGAEYSILFGTPHSVLERVQRIVLETHDNIVEYQHPDLIRFLTEHGFRVETFPNPVYSYYGYLRAIRDNKRGS